MLHSDVCSLFQILASRAGAGSQVGSDLKLVQDASLQQAGSCAQRVPLSVLPACLRENNPVQASTEGNEMIWRLFRVSLVSFCLSSSLIWLIDENGI